MRNDGLELMHSYRTTNMICLAVLTNIFLVLLTLLLLHHEDMKDAPLAPESITIYPALKRMVGLVRVM